MGPKGSGTDDSNRNSDRDTTHEFINKLLHHDLTNHLHVIQGNAGLLLEKLEDAETIEHLHTIQRQTEAAFSLLRESKSLVNGPRRGSLEAVDVSAAIEGELGHIEAAYPDAEITVEASGDVTVKAPSFLGSIFANLVRNAIEHNDATSPQVRVSMMIESERMALVVKDDGPGIPEDVLENLSDTATRTENGMGLYIVHSLVEEHDGTLSIGSDSDGTVIHIELPVGSDRWQPSSPRSTTEPREPPTIRQPMGNDESPITVILRTVAAASNRRIDELHPIAHTVDPDAVETILQEGIETHVEFRYKGYQIIANPDEIVIKSLEDE